MEQKPGMKLLELFHKAKKNKLWPKLKIQREYANGTTMDFHFALAGSNSRHFGCIHITDGRPFGTNTYFGKINRDGSLDLRVSRESEHAEHILAILASPVEMSIISGKKFNYCCFCGLTLTDPSSVHHGYGPICAGNWGLPWGDVPEEDIGDVELDISPEELLVKD